MNRSTALKCALVFACALVGCQPDIGDPCVLPSDCSLSGDRLCDTSLQGGYCTVFNCEPGGCPEEAVCVAYGSVPSSANACRDPQSTPRFQRTFCMETCSSDSDCRQGEGYACVEVEEVEAWSAAVVERGRPRKRVCSPPFDGVPLPEDRASEVCSASFDGSFPPPLSVEPSTDARAPSDAASDSAVDVRRDAASSDGLLDASSELRETSSDAAVAD